MERFLGKLVMIRTCLGGLDGAGTVYKGVITSYDDEFVCIDEHTYIVRKFILAVQIKNK